MRNTNSKFALEQYQFTWIKKQADARKMTMQKLVDFMIDFALDNNKQSFLQFMERRYPIVRELKE